MSNWHYFVFVEWIHFPWIRTFVEKRFHGLFSKRRIRNLGVFLRFWVEAEVNLFRRGKLCRQDYLDCLKNRAKSGDMGVLELKFRNVSLGKWSKNWSCYRRKKLPKSLPAGFETLSVETGPIPDCSFYLPVSMSRNDPVSTWAVIFFGCLKEVFFSSESLLHEPPIIGGGTEDRRLA